MTENERKRSFIRTFRIYFFVLMALMLAVVGRILYLQYLCGEEDRYSIDREYKSYVLPPTRGTIYSYDGKPLAVSITDNEIHIDFKVQSDSIFKADYRELADSLSALFGDRSPKGYEKYLLSCRGLDENLNAIKDRKAKGYAPVGDRDITFAEVKRMENFPILRLGRYTGGLIVEPKDYRERPYGSLARKVVGSINVEGKGSGIEKSFDYRLGGRNGERKKHLQNRTMVWVQGLRYTPAEDGIDIRTTIDVTIQETVEKALREQFAKSDNLEGGTAVVMDVSTGAIRAFANLKKLSDGTYSESFNYASGLRSEPGSTLKLSSLLAMLEDGYATLDTPVSGLNGTWRYGGIDFNDTRRGGYGQMTVKTAFEHSSNVAFAQLAVRYYENHEDEYVERIRSLKLGENLDLEIGEDASAYFRTPGTRDWYAAALPMMAIGYAVELTPLHTLTLYNAVANGGKMMKPYLVEAICRDGEDLEVFEPRVLSSSICSERTIKAAKEALRGVVADPEGTGKICQDDRYHISGKTGTAQRWTEKVGYHDAMGRTKHQASFAGFFPSENPRYSCIVLLYSGWTSTNFYGGGWACPIFKKIADGIYATHPWTEPLHSDSFDWTGVSMKEDALYRQKASAVKENIVPDVTGMGLRDALRLLENSGYTVTFTGEGTVTEQTPQAGDPASEDRKIDITLSTKHES